MKLMVKNLHEHWEYFESWLYLEDQELIKSMQKLYFYHFSLLSIDEENNFIDCFLKSKSENSKEEVTDHTSSKILSQQYLHQIVFMKLIYKTIFLASQCIVKIYELPILHWFESKILWNMVIKETQAGRLANKITGKHLTQNDILKKQILANLIFYFTQIDDRCLNQQTNSSESKILFR